ncbi:hypothetical protein RB195_020485 [Necator americanus]|uniref:G-protein coupled receptors family 1 profile domain-containing protein n=1 Tax=Necator americanus TaxID=51031 RepID=A0ABR1CKU1_NECAM
MDDSTLCAEAQDVAASVSLKCALIFNVLCGLIAIPFMAMVMKATYSHKLVHYNVKWILIFHLFCLIVHDAFRIVNHVWDLTIFLSESPNGCYLFDRTRCLLIRIPINATMYLSFTCTFMLSIERCVATWRLSSYGKNRVVGPLLIFIQMAAATLFMYIVIKDTSNTPLMTYCLLTSLSPPILILGPISMILLLQVIAIVTFEVLMKINKNMNNSLLCNRNAHFNDGVISKLYQVRENLRTTKTLMLFFLLSCVNSFAYNSLRGFVHLNKANFSRPLFFLLIEISIHLPQYSLLLPAVLWYSYRKVSRQDRKISAALLCQVLLLPISQAKSSPKPLTAGDVSQFCDSVAGPGVNRTISTKGRQARQRNVIKRKMVALKKNINVFAS